MSNLFISLRNVTIRYPDQTCFTNISFQIKEGEHWVFVGENEPLKNALIEALAGKAAIIKGRTEYHFFEKFKAAHNVNDPLLSATRLIAHVAPRHQFLNLSNTSQFYYQQRFNSSDSENALTVSEYLHRLKPALHTHGWTIDNTIAKLKLQPLLDEQLIKLSNGETRRLLIAAALLKSPVMLLLANPFNGLDVTARADLKMLINEVAASGITVVMSAAVNEIPDAITHVASFSNDNSISTQTKQRFRANVSTSLETESVDAAEVKSLMRLNGLPVFSNVVKMINVNIKYDDRLILNKINWTVRQGERWALSGHNGAGKSTLLSLISGDNPQAFANHIILFDRKKGSGESIWDIKKKIGFFSPELYQYFPLDTSCLHAVESGFYDTIGLFRPSSPRLASVALRWMKLLEVDHLQHRLLKHLSPTHQRLCLLARAFAKAPPLIILDEPCQGFDDRQRARFKQLVNTVCASGNVTLIYVSHYKEDIPQCVTKELILQDGKQVDGL